MRTLERQIVAAVLVSKDKKIFLAKQVSGGVYEGLWAIPGGGIEQNESAEQACIREVLEETGIDLKNYLLEKIQLSSASKTDTREKALKTGERVLVKMFFNVFLVEIKDKNSFEIQVKLNSEFSEYAWVSTKELEKLELPLPSQNLFKEMGFLNI